MRHEESQYIAENGADYVPVDKWGKDHWSTFAYLETRAVDGGGKIDNPRMRCDPRLHREFAHSMSGIGGPYPTRLKGDFTLQGHDDWSCLEDMVAAGFLDAYFWTARHGTVMGHMDARVVFTALGLQVANELRNHKAMGGSFASFEPSGRPETVTTTTEAT